MQGQIHEVAMLQRRIDRHLRRYIEKKVTDTGVYRSQHQLLMNLGKNPGCSQTQLAEHMGISTAAVTTSLKKLEKGGYIVRQMSHDDNRVNQPEITEKGEQVIKQSIQIFQQIDRDMYAGFSKEELNILQGYYERILQNLTEQNDKEA